MKLTRRNFLKLSLATCCSSSALYLSEEAQAYKPSNIVVEKVNIKLNNLPEDFEDFSIAQISDLHRSEVVENDVISKTISKVNSLKPDLIVITGDIANNLNYLEDCIPGLKNLSAPEGTYIVGGNWERARGIKKSNNMIKNAGLNILDNRYKIISKGKKKIYLAGVDDDGGIGNTLESTFKNINDKALKILLSHNPYITVHLSKAKKPIDLVLSGHTHGGQVIYPFIGAIKVPRAFGKEYISGLYNLKNTRLYINRGIGVVCFPYRINCPPEITLFKL
ncbi:MAG: metallophosphoesterase [Cyanobacteriota bacterium]